jgi:demethylmenaquinone methyltransferase / 2-methoxy-6-polyprenyl-1,4-benzoquinol methylase
MSRATLHKHPDEVAARYDITNDVLSLGQTHLWRRAVTTALDPQPGQRILDLAGGTGTSAAPLAAAGAFAVPCDFSVGMLQVGRSRLPQLPFTAGDALHLPFADGVFDAVTMSFGLRNVSDIAKALQEMRRVTRPGGMLLVCEFSSPTSPPLRQVYLEYLMRALPAVARKVSSNPDAYVYLAESIRAWPDQEHLAQIITDSGWGKVHYRNLTGGIVALHRAVAV